MSNRLSARLGSNLPTVYRIFFFAFLIFKYYFFIIWEYFLILPKNLEMPSTGTPKIPRFKINVSMCECCCPFFIFCLFFAFQRKVRILTTQKSLTTMHLVNFYRRFQKHNFIGPFKLFFVYWVSLNFLSCTIFFRLEVFPSLFNKMFVIIKKS